MGCPTSRAFREVGRHTADTNGFSFQLDRAGGWPTSERKSVVPPTLESLCSLLCGLGRRVGEGETGCEGFRCRLWNVYLALIGATRDDLRPCGRIHGALLGVGGIDRYFGRLFRLGRSRLHVRGSDLQSVEQQRGGTVIARFRILLTRPTFMSFYFRI